MKIKEYIDKIGQNRKQEDMEKLGEMLEETIYEIKEYDEDMYCEFKMTLYEMAYGKKLTKEMADDWVKSMEPVGLHWTYDDTTNVMPQLGYNLDNIEFYVVANMMYNDYFDIVKDDETLALKLANDWLKDTDAKEGKLYNYWKYIVK